MKNIIKGMIIGLGKVIPGVSGSMLAISLGIYEKCINSFTNILKDIESVIFLIQILIGILISIVFGSKLIFYFINNYYSYIVFIFIGLIMGSLKEIIVNARIKYWYISIISFIIMYLFSKINVNFEVGSKNIFFLYFIAGFIESISSIFPGISGTALLMSIKMYDKVLYILGEIFTFYQELEKIIPFSFGIFTGFIFSIKLLSFLFSKYKHQMYNAIIGFTIGSIFIMANKVIISIESIPFCIILLIIGIFCIKKVNHFF